MWQRQEQRSAIVGASGYTGEELVRLLLGHPHVDLVAVTSRHLWLANRWPKSSRALLIKKASALKFSAADPKQIAREARIVFLALPHGLAAEFAKPLLDAGARVLDLSADFRLKDADIYREFYRQEHPAPDLLGRSVYGLPEIYRDQIRDAKFIACPGCYPTSILIPLRPLIRRKAIDRRRILVASMSGVTGAGRKVDADYLFSRMQREHSAVRRSETSTSFRDRAGIVEPGRRKNYDSIYATPGAGESRNHHHDLRGHRWQTL